jgi:hypothetical protein
MTVAQLIVVLQQFHPDRRVLVPGQEFGLADVGDDHQGLGMADIFR